MSSLRERALEMAQLMSDGQGVDPAAFAHIDDTQQTVPPPHHPREPGRVYVPKAYEPTPDQLDPAAHADCTMCADWRARYGGEQAPAAAASPAGAAAPAPTVRPAGEVSPGFDALPEDVRGPLADAIGRALAEQQLVFAASGVLNAPLDVTRYLRPEDYVLEGGRPDVPAIRDAVVRLGADKPHLAVPQRHREAAQGAGQGTGSSTTGGMQARVDAVTAMMNAGTR